jgi:hypothetical protein
MEERTKNKKTLYVWYSDHYHLDYYKHPFIFWGKGNQICIKQKKWAFHSWGTYHFSQTLFLFLYEFFKPIPLSS